MKQFKSAGQAQRFLSAHDQINNLFHLRRDHVTAAEHRASRTERFQIWADIVEKVGSEIIVVPVACGREGSDDGGLASGGEAGRRHRDELGEFAEVLGGGGKVELVAGTVRSS